MIYFVLALVYIDSVHAVMNINFVGLGLPLRPQTSRPPVTVEPLYKGQAVPCREVAS